MDSLAEKISRVISAFRAASSCRRRACSSSRAILVSRPGKYRSLFSRSTPVPAVSELRPTKAMARFLLCVIDPTTPDGQMGSRLLPRSIGSGYLPSCSRARCAA